MRNTETNNGGVLPREIGCQTLSAEAKLSKFYTEYRNRSSPGRKTEASGDNLWSFIERFVGDCIASHSPGYLIVHQVLGKTQFISSRLAKAYFHQINLYLECFQESRFYSPPVMLFFSTSKALHLHTHRFVAPSVVDAHGVSDAERFNQLINGIRQQGRTPAYRKIMAQDSYRGLQRFRGLVDYVNALFDVRSRLIVIRLDLKYRSECVKVLEIDQAQKDLQHFFGNMRNKPRLFDDLVGYVWKLERSHQGSAHFHTMLFFTNDRLLNDCHRAEQIGRYWADVITKGRGCYFNCNRPEEKAKHLRPCLGRIEYHDVSTRHNLLYPLAYFCKHEQSIRVKPKKQSRAYGRGEMPPMRAIKPGRKRSIVMPADQARPPRFQRVS